MFHGNKDKAASSKMPVRKMVMEKKEIAPGIVVYSNVIPRSERLHLDIEEGMESAGIKWGSAYVRSGDEIKLEESSRNTQILAINHTDVILNDCSSLSICFYNSLSNLFFESFSPIEVDYKSMYAADTRKHESYSILKYGIGQNFVNHVDDHFEGPRRISHVHYLNENYEGGEIEFPRFGIKYKPKANESIFFPSGYVYNHSVHPVISGERYAIVSWLF
jgi:hypothetical protein